MPTKPMVVALGLFVAALTAVPALAQPNGVDRTISVAGEGRVNAEPNMATLQLGVTRRAETAGAALGATSAAAAVVLAVVEAAGIDPRDVQTSGLTLHPRWDRVEGDDGIVQMEILYYEASNRLTIRVRDLDVIGSLLDSAVSEDGANSFGGLSFGHANPERLLDEARRQAVADALRKAELLAEAAGVELGALMRLSDGGASTMGAPMMRAEMAMSADVPIASGELEFYANVHVEFAIAD